MTRIALLLLPAATITGVVAAPAAEPAVPPISIDCPAWTLDGYRLGMTPADVLAVRSVTLHVRGQAQAVEPGRFRGVLVFDDGNALEKWDVAYENAKGDDLRAEMRRRYGEPVSDVSGSAAGDDASGLRQRRTLWLSKSCDAAILVYETSGTEGKSGATVMATLARASTLRHGLEEMKSLFR